MMCLTYTNKPVKKKVIGVALGASLLALGIIGAHAQQAGKVFRIGYSIRVGYHEMHKIFALVSATVRA
jgi:hypothetical protein